jgi:hypothetical protein
MVSALLGAVCAYWIFDPVARLDKSQQAILSEYLRVYCGGPKWMTDDKMFTAGAAAEMSRIAIAVGIGELALAEYGKCKIGSRQ